MAMYIESKLSWVPSHGGHFPQNAVHLDHNVVVIRAQHKGRWTPGKAVQGHGNAYIPYGGNEISKHDYEVLVLSALREGHECYHWVPSAQGQLPNGALVAGVDVNDENLFVARGVINGEVCGGKLKPSHRGGYFPWGGKEHLLHTCEVLCFKI